MKIVKGSKQCLKFSKFTNLALYLIEYWIVYLDIRSGIKLMFLYVESRIMKVKQDLLVI